MFCLIGEWGEEKKENNLEILISLRSFINFNGMSFLEMYLHFYL